MNSAYIQLHDEATQLRFDWLGFDGEDSFADFRVTSTLAGQDTFFEFGRCPASGFRRLARFVPDLKRTQIYGAFRYSDSDIRTYNLIHQPGNRLDVHFRRNGLHEECRLQRPSVRVSDEFLIYLAELRPLNARNPQIADILGNFEALQSTLRECFRPILMYLQPDSVGEVLEAFPAELTEMYKDWVEQMPKTEEQWSQYQELIMGFCPHPNFTAEVFKRGQESEKQLSRRAVQILRDYFQRNTT
jgi:hypothetical protein